MAPFVVISGCVALIQSGDFFFNYLNDKDRSLWNHCIQTVIAKSIFFKVLNKKFAGPLKTDLYTVLIFLWFPQNSR